jgi:CRISPR-associated protein (TIGR02710 family)
MTDEIATPVILALTVGGSPDPLKSAIEVTNPDILLLIASAAAAASVSSRGAAEEFKTSFEASRPGRSAQVIEVPADDPGRAFALIVAEIDRFRSRKPGCHIVADYTGGTKSMSAALLFASFQRDLETQIMAGRRDDLAKVTSGTEAARRVDTRLIGVERDFATGLAVAARGDYPAAAGLLSDLRKRIEREKLAPPKSLGRRLKDAQDWADCFASWDRFDHKAAWQKLEDGLNAGASWAEFLETNALCAILKDLASGKDEPRVSLCQDLLANARRREAQGRFDDTVARLYRFTEACVQTHLYRRYKLKSDELNLSDLPPKLARQLVPQGNGRYKTPLLNTAEVLAFKDPHDPVAAVYLAAGDHGPSWLSARNKSILAHGYRAIGREVVKHAFDWLDKKLIPAMGMTPMPPFPTAPALG